MFNSINVKTIVTSIIYSIGAVLMAVALIVPPEWLGL